MTAVVGALDIGGTHVTAGRVRLAAATVEPGGRVRFAYADGEPLLASILRAAESIATGETRRFGIAAPGPFDYDAGVCLVSHKLPGLHGVNLRRELARALGLAGGAVSFLNDAEAFLLGEWWAGAARGHARAVGVTLGTGLGSAFLEEGRIIRSGPGVPADGALYALTFRGEPVENAISRGALLTRFGAEGQGGAGADVEQIAERAVAGQRHAQRLFEQLGADLGEFLRPTLDAFAPTCLVVGGSIALAWELFAPPLIAALGVDRPPTVTRAARIEDAALLGAAWHASLS